MQTWLGLSVRLVVHTLIPNMVYNLVIMRAAYWLSFALVLTPLIIQCMSIVFIGLGFALAARRSGARAGTQRGQLPVWLPFLFGVLVFVLALWQWTFVDDLFAGYSYDYGVEQVEVLGVSIPLELGENVNRFVNAAFSLLLNLWIVSFLVRMLLRARWRERVNVKARGWIFGALLLGCFGLAAWAMSRTLPYQIENLRALF